MSECLYYIGIWFEIHQSIAYNPYQSDGALELCPHRRPLSCYLHSSIYKAVFSMKSRSGEWCGRFLWKVSTDQFKGIIFIEKCEIYVETDVPNYVWWNGFKASTCSSCLSWLGLSKKTWRWRDSEVNVSELDFREWTMIQIYDLSRSYERLVCFRWYRI